MAESDFISLGEGFGSLTKNECLSLSKAEYKQLQENFVSNHSGSSLWECLVLICVLCSAFVLRNLMKFILGKSLSTLSCILLDIFTLHTSYVCAVTILSDRLVPLLTAQVSIIVTLILVASYFTPFSGNKSILEVPMQGKRNFISEFKACGMVCTVICILAVDFEIFPRRFSKAEPYGISLMDYGVGYFILANAIVSREAMGKMSWSARNFKENLQKSVCSSIPLLVLGCSRLIAIKSIDYQEHVTEYGVHWNFFLTMAVVKVATSIILGLISHNWSLFLGLSLGCYYQYMLSLRGLRRYILHGPGGTNSRDGFVNANREGLFSCLGYISLYFMGIKLGKFLFKPRQNVSDWLNALCSLLVLGIFLLVGGTTIGQQIEDVSRMTANLAYIILVMAVVVIKMCIFLLGDIIIVVFTHFKRMGDKKKNDKPTDINATQFSMTDAINRNSLAFFLLGNLLTGCVNLGMRTLCTSNFIGLLTVIAYVTVLLSITAFAHLKNITLKIW